LFLKVNYAIISITSHLIKSVSQVFDILFTVSHITSAKGLLSYAIHY